MNITRLSIDNLRILEHVDIPPSPQVNWFYGSNGAGKTSVLEALCVLAKGRSFRSGSFSSLIGPNDDSLRVVAGTGDSTLGVERWPTQWRGRINGQDAQRVADFARRIPVVLFEPGSHALVEGAPAIRRQYLDWTLFHVEHDYLDQWRRCARELRQRNAALRRGAPDATMDAFEDALTASSRRLETSRRALAVVLNVQLESIRQVLGANFGPITVNYRSGWPKDQKLEDLLRAARTTDRERGHTRFGPHRAELVLSVSDQPAAQRLSRGQQKLLSLIMLLAQHAVLSKEQNRAPLLLLDDPVSELDAEHLARLWRWVEKRAGQTWVTALTPPDGGMDGAARMFHVEQGQIRPDKTGA